MAGKIIYITLIILIITAATEAGQSEEMMNTQKDSTEFIMKKFKDGVDFYAMGNEPFWNLNLSINEFIHFNELEGVTINLGSVKGEKAMDANVTRYMSETVNGIFTMTMSGQECYDDMSGDTFTYKVIVELDNPGDNNYKKFEGCGRYVPDYNLNRTWILKKIGENEVVESNYQKGLPMISFDIENNRFSGSGRCNRIMGFVTAEADRLNFGRVASTMMACDNLDLEREFLEGLENTVNYKLMGNQLILSNPDNEIMTLHDPSMEPTTKSDYGDSIDYRLNDIWILENINDKSADERNYMKGLPRIEINIKDMTIYGNGGCNSLSGKVESGGNEIKFGPLATTRMMCPGNYESEFLTALQDADSFKIENNRLYLMQNGKTLIVFKKID